MDGPAALHVLSVPLKLSNAEGIGVLQTGGLCSKSVSGTVATDAPSATLNKYP